MSDDTPKIAEVISLPRTVDKGPLTTFSPELDTFEYLLMEKGYSDNTIRSYTSALKAGLEAFVHSAVPEARIHDALRVMSRSRRVTFKTAWHLISEWLGPRGYQITPLVKLPGGRPNRLSPLYEMPAQAKEDKAPPPVFRAPFRGFGDLCGFHRYLKQQGFGQVTVDLYFKIILWTLHFLEGNTRSSKDVILVTLEKAVRNGYDFVDPQSVRFLRVWAHLHDYLRPLDYEVTVWERPQDMRSKKAVLSVVTSPDTEKKDTEHPTASSAGEEAVLDDF